MNNRFVPLVSLGLAAGLFLTRDALAAGGTLAINFRDSTGQAVTAVAFGVASNGWYNAPAVGTTNNVQTVATSGGSSVAVTWSSSGTWHNSNMSGSGDNEVYYGYLDDGPNGSTQGNSVTISNLNAAFASGYVVETIGSAGDTATFLGSGLLTNATGLNQTLTYPTATNLSGSGAALSTSSTLLTENTIQFQGGANNWFGRPGARAGLAGLLITDKPIIVSQPSGPADNSVLSGASFSLTVQGLGVPTLAYQWRKNGTNISGANASTYTQGTATTNDAGNYDVVITNSIGSVTSSVVTISIATGTRLRIMSMNAAGGQGGFSSDSALLAQRVAAVQAAGADVVGLQEVDGDDIVAMAKALGWTNSMGSANSVTGERTDYVNPNGDTLAGRVGIISRYPVLNRIGQTTNNYGGVGATLQVSTNVRVHVFNTHLWWGAASTNAYPQGANPVTGTYGPYWQTHGSNWVSILNMENALLMPAVNELLELAKPYISNSEPVFLTGDFNLPSHEDYPATNPWPATVACRNAGLVDSYHWMHPSNRVATAGQFLATDPGVTWTSIYKTGSETGTMNGSSGTPAYDRIDFVFYSTNDNVNVTYSDTVDYGSLYSWQDHKFVLTTVFLNPVPNAVSKAINPFPATGATNVTLRPVLTWTAGTNAVARNVFFGTSSPGTLQTNTAATSFSPGLLVSNTVYFWRIDEIAGGVTNTGDVWQFTTGRGPFIKANKTVYAGTDTITVGFTNGPGNAKDWIALYRQTDGYGNAGYVDYFYVDGTKSGTTAKTNGSVTFSAIGGAGTNVYVVRFFKKDLYYVLDEASVTVTNPPFVPFSPATLPASYIEQESLVSGSQTILNFNDLPTGQTQNAAIASGFGNNAVASSAGVTVIGGGTPDIALTFAGDANGSHWDYYIDSTWRGVQLDPNGLIANVAWNLTFTPSSTTAAKINGFTFHPYPTANLWRLTFRIEVLDAVSSSVLFSTTNSFFEDGSKNGHWQNINYNGTTGQALKLRITRIASATLGSGEIEEPGASANYAVDDISFSEIPNAGSAGIYKDYISSLGPLAYYRLDDKPTDTAVCNFGSLGSAGNGVHSPGVTHPVSGAIVGDASTACQYGPGSGDTAGISDGRFTRIPYSASLNPASSFTVELWAKATTNTDNSTGPCPISNAHLTGNRGGWDIFQRTNSTGWNLQTFTGSGSTVGANITGGTATNGQWYHLAFICSAVGTGPNAGKVTNAFYVNGVLVGGSAYAAYNTNNIDPLFLGIENYKLENSFKGAVDEVAIYNKVLTGAQLLSHYQSGTNASRATPYSQTVTNDGGVNLVGYWRLGESGMTATNSGALGAAADGTYAGATYGSPSGPPSPDLPGFSPGNYCAYLNGSSNYITLGNPSGLNFTNQITLQAWVRPNAVQGAAANIISHGLNTNGSAEVALRITNNTYQIQAWNGTAHGVSAAIPAGDLGSSNWVQLAGTYDGTKWSLYRNGALLANATDSTGAVVVTNENWAIGARGAGVNQFYSGFVDEVAIFNRALTSNEIAAAYSAANPTNPPTIQTQPTGQTTNAGGTFSLSVVAGGSPLLAYQWARNQTNIVGATNATYLRTNAASADSGFYSVVVTNRAGSAESIAVAVTVNSLTAGAVAYTRTKGLGLKIDIADLLTNVTGSGCAPMTLAGVGASTNGTVITTNSTYIFFAPTNNNSESFTYTAHDACGGSATGIITVYAVGTAGSPQAVSLSNSVATVALAGIPGYQYGIQRSTNLTVWATVWTTNAPAHGLFQFVDTFSDLGGIPPSSVYYRMARP